MSQAVRLDQLAIAVFVALIFGYIGYQRGILRELFAAPAILLAPTLGPWLGQVLKPWINRCYRLILFARFGGLATDDLGSVMAKVRKVPPLISTPADAVRAGVVCFLLVILSGYLIGEWRIKGPKDRATRLLGALIGIVNGYVLVQVVLPRFWTAQFAVIIVPTASVLQLFHGHLALALVFAFAVLVLFALRLARGK